MYVYLLQHSRDNPDGPDDVKDIGIYSTEGKAKEAIARVKDKPGFASYPNGFNIDRYLVDEDNWTSGFGGVYEPPEE